MLSRFPMSVREYQAAADVSELTAYKRLVAWTLSGHLVASEGCFHWTGKPEEPEASGASGRVLSALHDAMHTVTTLSTAVGVSELYVRQLLKPLLTSGEVVKIPPARVTADGRRGARPFRYTDRATALKTGWISDTRPRPDHT